MKPQYIQMTDDAAKTILEKMTSIDEANGFVEMNNAMLKANFEVGFKYGFKYGIFTVILLVAGAGIGHVVCKKIDETRENRR